MHRFLITAAGFLAVSVASLAQHTSSNARPVMNERDAGIYHLATGTWSRHGPAASAWHDVIFDNTCRTGYFQAVPSNSRIVDDGRIPSTTSPTNPGPPASAISWTGTRDRYVVNYFELAYCTYTPLPTLQINFWECFSGCADATLLTPTAALLLNNMPGAIGTGGICWVTVIDLANTGLSFSLNADCDGVWSGGGVPDTFGWSWQQVTPSVGGTGGPFIAGDPLGYLGGGPGSSGCEFGANTIFYAGVAPTSEGTGLDGMDQWETDTMTPTPVYQGCFWFGGYYNGGYYSSFHMEMGAETTPPCCDGNQFCPGDGTGTQCPCANNNDGSASPAGGCNWSASFLGGGVLTGAGSAYWGNNDTYLIAQDVADNFGIFFGGHNQTNGGAGSPLNDGLRCVGGGVVRLNAPLVATGNTLTIPAPVQSLDPGGGPGITRYYQYWFRTPMGPCGTTANLTNGLEINWM